MASQLRCTSKSVDLLQTYHQYISIKPLSLQPTPTSCGQANVLCGEEQDLERRCDNGTLRQRRIHFSHHNQCASCVGRGRQRQQQTVAGKTGRCFCACPSGKSAGRSAEQHVTTRRNNNRWPLGDVKGLSQASR